MSTEILNKLKEFKKERSEIPPFSNHLEYMKWVDAVSPLLSFNAELKSKFDDRSLSADVSNGMGSDIDSDSSKNETVGILNQAIAMLEINPIPDSTLSSSSNDSNDIHNWHNKPLGKIAIGVTVIVLGAIVVWLLNHNLRLGL